MSEDNRAELSRLIKEHLEDRTLSTAGFLRLFPEDISDRSVFFWMSGSKVPGTAATRAALEAALDWKAGSVREVLGAKVGTRFELSELRDWEKLGIEPEPPRLADFATEELVVELSRRVGAAEKENEYLARRIAELESEHSSERRSAYGLAANDTSGARMQEHLER